MPVKIYDRNYTVCSYDIGSDQKILPTVYIKYLQDVGMWQDELLHTAESEEMRDIAWIFVQYELTFYQYLRFSEEVNVKTIPFAMDRFYAYRRYEIRDKEGNLCVEARAKFVAIDKKTRGLKRVTEEMGKYYGIHENQRVMMDKPKTLTRTDIEKDFSIRYTDIDINGHVNNTKYVEWALETVPLDVVRSQKLAALNIFFKKECTYGSNILVKTEKEGDQYYHEILQKETGEVLAVLETRFEKMDA